jgi:BirA family biotin operon repressor/biotin-[acetyl-CoA-carboxylase] ligase
VIARLTQRLREALEPAVSLVVLRDVGSTNDLARRIVGEYVDDGARQPRAVVVALSQTAGRGRAGRRWESPPEVGLYCSMLRALPADRLSVVPLALAVALRDALGPFLPQPPQLKWPNDLLTPEGKVAGILVEAVRRGPEVHGIVGVGVNLRRAEGQPSTAAALGGGALEPTLEAVTGRVVEACWRALDPDASVAATIERWSSAAVHQPGDLLAVADGTVSVQGRYLGVHSDGRLRLEREGQQVLVASGDVEQSENG